MTSLQLLVLGPLMIPLWNSAGLVVSNDRCTPAVFHLEAVHRSEALLINSVLHAKHHVPCMCCASCRAVHETCILQACPKSVVCYLCPAAAAAQPTRACNNLMGLLGDCTADRAPRCWSWRVHVRECKGARLSETSTTTSSQGRGSVS